MTVKNKNKNQNAVTPRELATGDKVWRNGVVCTILAVRTSRNGGYTVAWSEPYPDRPRTVLVTTEPFRPGEPFGNRVTD